MRDLELETMIVGDFRYLRREQTMNGSATGEKYWKIEEVPRIDGELQTFRKAGPYGYQKWRDEYDPRRYPELIEQIQWRDLVTAQLAAIAATGISHDTNQREYLNNVAYAAKILNLPQTP